MKAVHVPLKNNYPHSEVQVFESKWEQTDVSVHLDKKTIPGVPRERGRSGGSCSGGNAG